ncbi:hypothetical protein KP509_36G040900 [Ceratopteris richardii]|nr:hypothetical protein KP509_36G040900 [Ceratopteris richardii]
MSQTCKLCNCPNLVLSTDVPLSVPPRCDCLVKILTCQLPNKLALLLWD